MKHLILLALIIQGCGAQKGIEAAKTTNPSTPGACSGFKSVGTWKNNLTGDIMVSDVDCLVTTTYCNEKFTYTVQADQTTTVVAVTRTNGGPECIPLGTKLCGVTFTSSDTLMQVSSCNLNGATRQYQRQ